ncbi:MAG: 3-hydroxyacyl-ACP dehydratase FabZ [Chromatiales bacterium]|nr:3-hydroxyacyl-ACP dehydratase FabZ [Chromatiales bacterium]
MGTLNINEVMRYLPHRFPFLLVDRVLEYEAGKSLTALKNVTMNEPFFQGHFPNKPIMPGVLVIEALAQATGLLAFCTQEQEPSDNFIYMLVSVDKARFKRQVIPGDALTLEVEVTRRLRGMWKFDAVARVGDEVAASAELMCAGREIDT